MEKTKVLIVAGKMDVGGIENQLMHLLRKADKARFQIDFTSTEDNPFYKKEIEELGSRCLTLPASRRGHYFKYCKALYHLMRKNRYDIVHSHELFFSGFVCLIARLAGVPNRFVHAHNWSDGSNLSGKSPLIRRMYNLFMQLSIQMNGTCFIACSTLAGKYLFGNKIVKQENYHLIYNSVDTNQFLEHYNDPSDGEFVDSEWINIIQVGRFSNIKNQLFTADIAAELKQRNRKIRILCVGNTGNAYEDRVVEKINQLEIEDYMLLLGIRKDIAQLMRQSSAFLLPSRYEGMPLVLIEAQASGLPCIVADTFSHEVDFGIGTVIWQNLDEDASRWADLIEEAVKRKRAPKEAVAEAISRNGFDSDTFAEKICSLYEKSCRRPS